MNPINGLEIANQSGITSRKFGGWRVRRREEACCVVFTVYDFSWDLIRRPIDPRSARRARATQQGVIHKSRTSDNHRWALPIPGVQRATQYASAAGVAHKSGSPPWFLSEEAY